MPLQRGDLLDIVIGLVEESDPDSKIFDSPGDAIFHLLLPYTKAGYDSSIQIVDHSQLLTEFYEN